MCIVIYPLTSSLFRVQLTTTKEGLGASSLLPQQQGGAGKGWLVAEMGPLLDGMVVSGRRLAGLVRAGALNASEALRRRTEGWVPLPLQRHATLAALRSPAPDLPFAGLLLTFPPAALPIISRQCGLLEGL